MDLLLYIQGGSWHGHAYYGDMVTSNSYQAHGYLKAQIIDYWSSMTSKYRVSFKSALNYLQFFIDLLTTNFIILMKSFRMGQIKQNTEKIENLG